MRKLMLQAALALLSAPAALAQNTITPASLDERGRLATAAGYPPAWTWDPAHSVSRPQAATGGTPRIQQYRHGRLIATYRSFADNPGCEYKGDGTDWQNPAPAAAKGCGPFTRAHSWRLFAPGDVFEVFAAVYEGPAQQPYIGPVFTGDRPFPEHMESPDNVTIKGVSVGGKWPVLLVSGGAADNNFGQAAVYFGRSTGVTWSNIIVQGAPGVVVGKAGLFNEAASNLTMINDRVSGFGGSDAQPNGANGIFGAGAYTGFWHMTGVEADHNGGNTGLAHDIYISASATDPNYRVTFTNGWLHDVFFGHLFKCRCQSLVLEGNYFEGGVPQPGNSQADDYGVDYPDGGTLISRGNIYVKNASGESTNGISQSYGMEGLAKDGRTHSIDIENNTFVAFARSFDGPHRLIPMGFMWPHKVPGEAGFPVAGVTVRNNVFAGYPPAGAVGDYRGEASLSVAFSELNQDFSLKGSARRDGEASSAVGEPAYAHMARPGARRATATVGAMD